ncbi:MAG: RNA polymerase factor sigma-54, partial [Porticoccaceae bacterium]
MRPGLQLKISQQLTMTPQLQQAIRLLQLSTLELRQEVIEQLYNNPLLEMDEENSRPISDKEEDSSNNLSDNDVDFNSDDPSHHQAAADATEQTVTDAEADRLWEQNNSQELAVDASWDEVYSGPSTTSGTGAEVNIEQVYQVTESLQDHLHWQL